MATFSSEQLAFFIQHGFVIIRPTVPEGENFHKKIADACIQLDAAGELGNNLLPSVPELGNMLDAPEVVGALRIILGEDYALMPHRHCHVTDEGSRDQPFHRDSFFGSEQFRHLAPAEVMLNYYPQRVTEFMGPTALLPGSQNCQGCQVRGGMELEPGSWGDGLNQFHCETDEPGVCVIMHYHLWHRGTGRAGLKPDPCRPPRWMLKFQFRRTRPFSDAKKADPRENPFSKACSEHLQVGTESSEETLPLPVPLLCVAEAAQRTWMIRFAPIWASVWAALFPVPDRTFRRSR